MGRHEPCERTNELIRSAREQQSIGVHVASAVLCAKQAITREQAA
jgi:hypothetical protein